MYLRLEKCWCFFCFLKTAKIWVALNFSQCGSWENIRSHCYALILTATSDPYLYCFFTVLEIFFPLLFFPILWKRRVTVWLTQEGKCMHMIECPKVEASLWKLNLVGWATLQGCRAGEVGRDHWALVQLWQIALGWDCGWGLSISTVESSTASLGKLCQCLVLEQKGMFVLCLNRISKHCCSCPFSASVFH